ncbi:MAG: GNAT family N-acetyltransferase [Acidobacteriota bacterium]
MMAETVRDNPARHRFELDADGHTAFTEYTVKPGVITFVHTEVPPALGGRGAGTRLVRGALDAVRARGLKVVAQCPFVAAFIRKHKEYQDLLA